MNSLAQGDASSPTMGHLALSGLAQASGLAGLNGQERRCGVRTAPSVEPDRGCSRPGRLDCGDTLDGCGSFSCHSSVMVARPARRVGGDDVVRFHGVTRTNGKALGAKSRVCRRATSRVREARRAPAWPYQETRPVRPCHPFHNRRRMANDAQREQDILELMDRYDAEQLAPYVPIARALARNWADDDTPGWENMGWRERRDICETVRTVVGSVGLLEVLAEVGGYGEKDQALLRAVGDPIPF